MAKINISFEIPKEVISVFRKRYENISKQHKKDKDFMKVIFKGALKVDYLAAKNKLWAEENQEEANKVINGI